jgi:hypothetical protein
MGTISHETWWWITSLGYPFVCGIVIEWILVGLFAAKITMDVVEEMADVTAA